MRSSPPSAPRYRVSFRLTAPIVAALFLLSGAAWSTNDEALTDEDVVRMFVSGEPTERIIETIRGSQVRFDVSDDMLEELRLAGLPTELLRAMTDRQREIDRVTESGDQNETAEETTPLPSLLVRLEPDWKPTEKRPRPVVQVLDVVDPQTHEQLRLRDDDPRFTDVAIALLCRTQDHVPDHWRSQSPLGRDFVNAPRHRLLAFVSGAEREQPGQLSRIATKVVSAMTGDDLPETALLVLELPETLAAPLEPNVVHDLTIALALQVEGRFYVAVADNLDGVETGGEPTVLDVTISGEGAGEQGLAGLGVSFVKREPGED